MSSIKKEEMTTRPRMMVSSLSSCTSFSRSNISKLTSKSKLENNLQKLYRDQLQNNGDKGMYFVKVNYEDLMNMDEGLLSVYKNYPNHFQRLVRNADLIIFRYSKPSRKITRLTNLYL